MLTAFLLAASAPAFDPLRFVAGQTQGEGKLKVILRRSVAVSVSGRGKLTPDGYLLLQQSVREGSKPARQREWRLRQAAPGRYEGTLSDARGPVVGKVEGRRLRLRFTSTSGFQVRQLLTLSADGRSADNVLRASRIGVPVATLHERITKLN